MMCGWVVSSKKWLQNAAHIGIVKRAYTYKMSVDKEKQALQQNKHFKST